MSADADIDNLTEAERDRQRLVEEMIAESGPQWADEFRPGSFGCHELLDRVARAADDLESHLLAHPACIQNREWFELAERAASLLRDLYQRIGEKHL